jgi:hypothetical protein
MWRSSTSRGVDTINDAARGLLAGMRATLSSVGQEGFLADPDNAVVRAEKQDDFDVVVFGALDDAVAAAKDLQGSALDWQWVRCARAASRYRRKSNEHDHFRSSSAPFGRLRAGDRAWTWPARKRHT